MAEGPDRRAFEVVTAPSNSGTPEFGDVAKVVAAADTLEAFLRDIRAKFPDAGGPAPTSPAQPAVPATSTPRAAVPAGKAG